MTTLTYQHNYLNESREGLLEKVAAVMSEARFEHVLRVEATALKLAKKYQADLEKVSIAALLHDYAKEAPDRSMRDVIISENLDLDLLSYGNPIWHGPAGAVLATKHFDVTNPEILEAIACHTYGSGPDASRIQKIIFVADYIEPQRNFPVVDQARAIAEHSLDEAVFFELVHTLKYLIEQEVLVYPATLKNYNVWVNQWLKKEKVK